MPTAIDMNSPVAYSANTGLLVFGTYKPIEHPINVSANLVWVAGTVFGELSASLGTFKPYAGSIIGTPASQTPVLTTSTTGGLIPGGVTYFVVYTWRNGAGETVKSTEASIAVPSTTNTNTITVTAPIALPVGALGINVYLGTVTATDYYVGTAPGNVFTATAVATGVVVPPGSTGAIVATDGSQTAKCVARYGGMTDALGNIYLGHPFQVTTGYPIVNIQSGNLFGGFFNNAPVPEMDGLFGAFECWAGDLFGLDTAAITAGFGSIENGVIGSSSAVFRKA